MEQKGDVRGMARQMGGLSTRWVSGATGSAQPVPVFSLQLNLLNIQDGRL